MSPRVRPSTAGATGSVTGGRSGGDRQPQLHPIVQDSTPSLIAAQLREAIATGHFRPGEQLAETALATSLGVSRGPLREAMQRLTQEGLLVGHRNRGLFVMALDDEVIRDIYVARSPLERAAIERVIEQGWTAQAAGLLEIVGLMRTDDQDAAADADIHFHERLVALSRSPRLVSMHATLLTQIRMCLTLMKPSWDSPEHRATEHEAIVQAILDRQADRADRLLREHMADGLARIMSTREQEIRSGA